MTAVSQTTVAPVSSQAQQQTQDQYEATLASWGKPLGLPAPVAPVVISSNGNGLVDTKKTPTANGSPLKRAATTNGNKTSEKATNGSNNSAAAPFYVDLAYIPHHCDPQYADVEFFRRIRARHYVLSSLEPSAAVLDALLEGKQSWTGDDKELGTQILIYYFEMYNNQRDFSCRCHHHSHLRLGCSGNLGKRQRRPSGSQQNRFGTFGITLHYQPAGS